MVWAMVTVVMPRPAGQPINCCMKTKSNSIETPVMTSGMTSGAETSPENKVRPRNRENRAIAMPAMVPRMVAKVALMTAISSDSIAASRIWLFLKSLPYHCVENPPHTVASRDLLKEKKIIEMIGM